MSMPAEQSEHLFDPRLLTALISLASLLLTFWNLYRTRKVRIASEARDNAIREAAETRDNAIREAAIKREQFNEVTQRPIRRILDKFEEIQNRLSCISEAGNTFKTEDIEAVNIQFTEAHNELIRRLRNASNSELVSGNDWPQITSDAFDSVCENLNAAYNPTLSLDDRCKSISKTADCISLLCEIVTARLESEIKALM